MGREKLDWGRVPPEPGRVALCPVRESRTMPRSKAKTTAPVSAPGPEPPPLRLEWRSPAELAENPANWRRHPEAQLAALTDTLAEVGWAGACLYNLRTKRLIDGHARKQVALDQGAAKIPVLVGDWSEEQEKKILATLDPLAAMATADQEQLDALLRDVHTGSQALSAMLTELAQANDLVPGLGNGQAPQDAPAEEEDWGEEDEDGLDLLFKSPFPWFGGKARIARMVWKRFGDVQGYLEPFFGSGAVLLNRPQPFAGVETVNDADALVCNFWRAVKADPDRVAEYADWPVVESCLHARHTWLVARKDTLAPRLEGDPDWFDAKVAGWWVWGMACWIGTGFCRGDGPWQVVEAEDGTRQLVHLGDAGQGVHRKLVHLGNAGQGVKRQRVNLPGRGHGNGVNTKIVADAGGDNAGLGERGLLAWMRALSERLRRVRVCCGDWTRVCGGQSGDALTHCFAAGEPCGVFLDPPYDLAERDDGCYNSDAVGISAAVRAWAFRHGDDPRLRLALCGYAGEHQMPASWTCVAWKAPGGIAACADAANSRGQVNAHRERVWFSPHCVTP